jgi:hypothetical protein
MFQPNWKEDAPSHAVVLADDLADLLEKKHLCFDSEAERRAVVETIEGWLTQLRPIPCRVEPSL